MVVLIVDGSYHILLGIRLIPNGSDLVVFVKTERYLAHNNYFT